jgi:hypothetical protein
MSVATQARGVSYPNVTDAYAATSTGVDQQAACACTTDGNSGSTFLGSNLAGCKQHGLSVGDNEYYCYVKGGSGCLAATSSTSYPGKQPQGVCAFVASSLASTMRGQLSLRGLHSTML